MKIKTKITILLLVLIAIGCSKEEDETPVVVQSDAKQITSFVFNAADNAALDSSLTAAIDEAAKTISASVPFGTDVSALTPTVSVSAKASVSRTGAQNFSSSITYTVTAEDDTSVRYAATITVLDLENSAPLEFDLIALSDNTDAVDLYPTFSWNATTDPDGDTITYDLYLGEDENVEQLYAENLADTTFEVTERLGLLQEYTWRVVAKDPDGASVSTAINMFTTRTINFDEITENAQFTGRRGHSSIVFDNKMWVIGGFTTSEHKNDVWSSEDGISWTQVTDAAAFSARRHHTSVVFDSKMWVIGGTGSERANDVWYSTDGITWTEATSNAAFTERYNHTSIVFDDKMWLIGGQIESNVRLNDVWFSEDGVTWSEADVTSPFPAREAHTSVVFDNKMWVIAGFGQGDRNDAWYSTDGIVWTEATNEAPFSERHGLSTVVFDNKLWVIGGINRFFERRNDIWFSKDGITWEEATSAAPFTERWYHSSLVFKDEVWVIGGDDDNGRVNDVWNFD